MPGRLASAVEEDQTGAAGLDAEEVRAEVVVKPVTAKVLVLILTEGQQVGNLQMGECALDGPVLVFAAATHRVTGGHHKIHAGLVEGRYHAFLEHAHGIIDIAHDRETETAVIGEHVVDAGDLFRVQGLEIRLEQVQVGLVPDQQYNDRQADVEQHF